MPLARPGAGAALGSRLASRIHRAAGRILRGRRAVFAGTALLAVARLPVPARLAVTSLAVPALLSVTSRLTVSALLAEPARP